MLPLPALQSKPGDWADALKGRVDASVRSSQRHRKKPPEKGDALFSG